MSAKERYLETDREVAKRVRGMLKKHLNRFSIEIGCEAQNIFESERLGNLKQLFSIS